MAEVRAPGATEGGPRPVTVRRLAAPPAREITEREEDDDDDDDPQDDAEDAPPSDDTRSFRPFWTFAREIPKRGRSCGASGPVGATLTAAGRRRPELPQGENTANPGPGHPRRFEPSSACPSAPHVLQSPQSLRCGSASANRVAFPPKSDTGWARENKIEDVSVVLRYGVVSTTSELREHGRDEAVP